MTGFREFLLENKKKEQKPVFVEYGEKYPFPNDTLSALRKDINKKCKDLETEWNSAVEVVNAAFKDLNVPIPKINLFTRWQQYLELIKFSVKNLYDARGMNASWASTI